MPTHGSRTARSPREFSVGPHEVLTVPNLSAEVIGATRDRLGDRPNFQVDIEALYGDGAVTGSRGLAIASAESLSGLSSRRECGRSL